MGVQLNRETFQFSLLFVGPLPLRQEQEHFQKIGRQHGVVVASAPRPCRPVFDVRLILPVKDEINLLVRSIAGSGSRPGWW